jgi:hypothetical protein
MSNETGKPPPSARTDASGSSADQVTTNNQDAQSVTPHREVTITMARSHSESIWNNTRAINFNDLAHLLSKPEVGTKNGSCYTPATFSGNSRRKDEAVQIDVAVLDSDCGHTLKEIEDGVRGKGFRAIVHSTHSHMSTETVIKADPFDKWSKINPDGSVRKYLLEKNGYLPRVLEGATVVDEKDINEVRHLVVRHQPCPKFRIIILLKAPWVAANFTNQSEANDVWRERIGALAHHLGLRHDQSCVDTSRLFYLPRIKSADALFEYTDIDGDACDLFALQPIEMASLPTRQRTKIPAKEAITKDGEVIDLKKWAGEFAPRFEIAKALDARSPNIFAKRVNGVKRHIMCPNADCHITGGGDESGAFVVNASELPMANLPLITSGFVIKCMHAGCANLDRLDHLSAMLEQGTLHPEDLVDERFLAPVSIGTLGAMVEVPWPNRLADEAFHGLAGEVVRTIGPISEADPAALLIQFLVAFGNYIGRSAYFVVEGDKHYTNLFAVLVGKTSKARKGTSWGRIRELFRQIRSIIPGELAAKFGISEGAHAFPSPDTWVEQRNESGLSSGEGLVWGVRDPIKKFEKDKNTHEMVEKIIDPGISDKRLMVQESEFANVLKVMTREGNTLSRIIRDAWDRGDLASMTKNSPARATGAHISLVGHITKEELSRLLDATEMCNGFANRHLFICVCRSKSLPEGGQLSPEAEQMLIDKLSAAVACARKLERIHFDEDARNLWHEVYPNLSEGKDGMVGAITSRAEAQVLRLALVYAAIDGSQFILLAHLRAALAVWDYAEASAAHIFGNFVGDPIADTILRALRGAGSNGLTRNDLNELFGGHKSSSKIGRALQVLQDKRLIALERKTSPGRAAEVWRLQG